MTDAVTSENLIGWTIEKNEMSVKQGVCPPALERHTVERLGCDGSAPSECALCVSPRFEEGLWVTLGGH